MSELRKDTAAAAHGGRPDVPGPDDAPARVLNHFESAAHRDPAEAWRAFTTAWNWAAPLTTAATAGDRAQAPARPDGGGFSLSGRWRLPSQDETDHWMVLPLHAPGTRSASAGPAPGGPDLFVVPSRTLAGGVRGRGTTHTRLRFPFVRLEDVHVPTGFTAYSTAEPLRSADGPFFWTATAGLALGAARRIVDASSAPEPDAASRADTASRSAEGWAPAGAEPAAVLHDERLSLAAALGGAPPAAAGARFPTGERLAARYRRVAQVVHHAVASAYELSLASCGGIGDPTPVHLIDAGAPILQLARYAVELLPPADTISSRKAEHGDDRRISG